MAIRARFRKGQTVKFVEALGDGVAQRYVGRKGEVIRRAKEEEDKKTGPVYEVKFPQRKAPLYLFEDELTVVK